MLTKRAPFFPLLLPGFAALVMGCGGYTSSYVPPPDGRPRLVWSDDKLVAMMANPMPQACSDAVSSVATGGGSVPIGGRHVAGGHLSGGFYVPVRTVVVVHGGVGIVPVPRPILPGFSGGGRSSGGGGVFSGLGGSGGGGSGSSGDLGKAAIVLVVVAIASLPLIALGLALGRPEPEGPVATAIDQVNAHTDLARTQGSPCDELVVAGEVAQ